MRARSGTHASSRSAIVLRWAERLFVIAGIVMLSWCVLLVGDAGLSQWKARHSLEAVSLAVTVGPPPRFPGEALAARSRAPIMRPGSVVADLSIPRVALASLVLHGSDDQTLRRGPGHLENTALPGASGNVVIAGHRDSFFRRLRDVAIGDDIFLATPEARVHYRVTSLRVVDAHDLSVLDQTDDAILTLITCYPFWVLGPAPDRFVVRAALVATSISATFAVRPSVPYVPASVPATPASPARTVNDDAVVNRSTSPDDTTLVRETIERFRLTYNARLVSHNDARRSGPLEFHSCDVALEENQAIAICATGSSPQPGEDEPGAWRIALERVGRAWAIRSIVAN